MKTPTNTEDKRGWPRKILGHEEPGSAEVIEDINCFRLRPSLCVIWRWPTEQELYDRVHRQGMPFYPSLALRIERVENVLRYSWAFSAAHGISFRSAREDDQQKLYDGCADHIGTNLPDSFMSLAPLGLADWIAESADWRRRVALCFPGDQRNLLAAEILDRLHPEIGALAAADTGKQVEKLFRANRSRGADIINEEFRRVGFFTFPATGRELLKTIVKRLRAAPRTAQRSGHKQTPATHEQKRRDE